MLQNLTFYNTLSCLRTTVQDNFIYNLQNWLFQGFLIKFVLYRLKIIVNNKLDCFRLIAFAMTARLKVWHTFITYTLLSINNFIKWTTIAPRTCVRTWDVTLRQAFIEKIKFCILLILADKIFTSIAPIVSVRVQALLANHPFYLTLVRA